MLGAFMAVLDIQITNASLKDILGTLGATMEEGSWVTTSYLVAEIVVIPLTGWLATVFSPRRYLLATTTAFLAASAACALAWGMDKEPAQLSKLRHGDWAGIVTVATGLGCLITLLEEGNRNDWLNS
jgi:DHA2 family multidrug resistance protein